jgi:hypothetical protein
MLLWVWDEGGKEISKRLGLSVNYKESEECGIKVGR